MPQFNSEAWRNHNSQLDLRNIRGGLPKIGAAYQPKPYIWPAIHLVTPRPYPWWKKVIWFILFVLFFLSLNFVLGVKPN